MPSTAGVFVDGAARLSRTTKAAARSLLDLRAGHAAAGESVLPAARDAVPKVTGRLGRSVRAVVGFSSFSLESDEDYAGVIHWGWPARHITAQPFAATAVRENTQQITRVVATDVGRVLRTVKGA